MRSDAEKGVTASSWRRLLGSREGFRAILREAALPLRHLAGSLLGGLILGAVVLAIDNRGYWFFPTAFLDRIIWALPVTTPGAPGGQMNGM